MLQSHLEQFDTPSFSNQRHSFVYSLQCKPWYNHCCPLRIFHKNYHKSNKKQPEIGLIKLSMNSNFINRSNSSVFIIIAALTCVAEYAKPIQCAAHLSLVMSPPSLNTLAGRSRVPPSIKHPIYVMGGVTTAEKN